jgi:hypothetical protein
MPKRGKQIWSQSYVLWIYNYYIHQHCGRLW